MSKSLVGKVIGGLLLVALGSGAVFAGFEAAAYEQTIADREVTVNGTVTETEVYQLPDGNWTYRIEFDYQFDQEAEILDQGLEDLYPDEMAGEQTYSSVETGGKHKTQSSARSSMESEIRDDGSVLVYVDPFSPGSGSLDDATSWMPEYLQWGGSVLLFFGLFGIARMARRVSA